MIISNGYGLKSIYYIQQCGILKTRRAVPAQGQGCEEPSGLRPWRSARPHQHRSPHPTNQQPESEIAGVRRTLRRERQSHQQELF